MSKYKIKAKCTSYYYGYPQARSTIVLKGIYFTAKVEWYGNQGFDSIVAKPVSNKCNGYFWELNAFMKAFYDSSEKVQCKLRELKEQQEITLEV